MPAAEVPSVSSIPGLDPPKVTSMPGNCGETVDFHPTSTSKSASNPIGLRSVKQSKSVESLPSIGTLPLGSLRITGPRENSDLDTPLTTPDVVMEPPLDSGHTFPTGGDVLILDDLPAGFTIGCDTMSFSTKKPFPGFRDIPAGAHLIWVAPSELTSSRSAYWIVTPKRQEWEHGEVYVKQWDKFNEVLSDPASQAEDRFQKEALQQIFSSLSSYQLRATTSGVILAPPSRDTEHLSSFLNNENIWSQLTSAINADLLNRITGKTQRSWQITTQDSVAGETTLAEEARLYASGKSQLRFTFPMNAPLISPKASGQERTRQALDPTPFVLETLENRKLEDLAGELSFAFLSGMHLGNYSCLEQWWFYTTHLIFRCYTLATAQPQLARRLIQTFHAQLVYNDRHLEGDVLEMMPSNARKLQRSLTTYASRLDELFEALGDDVTPDQHLVRDAFSDLEAWLNSRLGWDLRAEYLRAGSLMLEDGEMVSAEMSDFEDEDERGEFAPVVVQLDGGGKEAGLLSWDT
ncbi:AAR2 protein-domain-containing protein [Daldinia vernicosa]|uniref:AAR2 protein-domain-containing protein n=1 Tax=Daldinia vernicosa TaxID=114800 RepID=UPI0020078F1E|nr:AAR2 protein-domain-containing protein [Daldinia vernicosa]KAI0850891.1 AAR2 protein-domain-containing protein [Daldinia vernicosa]